MVEEKSEARVEYMTCYISYRPHDGPMSEKGNIVEWFIQLLSSPDHPFEAVQDAKRSD